MKVKEVKELRSPSQKGEDSDGRHPRLNYWQDDLAPSLKARATIHVSGPLDVPEDVFEKALYDPRGHEDLQGCPQQDDSPNAVQSKDGADQRHLAYGVWGI